MKSMESISKKSQSDLDYLSELGETKISIQSADFLSLKKEFKTQMGLDKSYWIFQIVLLSVATVSIVFVFISGNKGVNEKSKNYSPRNVLFVNYESFAEDLKNYLIQSKTVRVSNWKGEKFIQTPSKKKLDSVVSVLRKFELENMENLEVSSLDLQSVGESSDIKKSFLNIIFINGMKIANYHKYYFKNNRNEIELIQGNDLRFSDLSDKKNWESETSGELHEYPITDILKSGIKAFNENNFKLSQHYFGILLNMNKYDVNALFYIALAEFSKGNYQQSIIFFRKSLDIELNPFDEESEFYLAQSLFKINENEEAVSILRGIISKGGFYQNRAKKLIEGLK